MIRVSFPVRGWAKFAWRESEPPTRAQHRAILHLADIPGVRFGGTIVDVPHTAYMLDAFHAFLEAAGLDGVWAEKAYRHQPPALTPAVSPAFGLYPWQHAACNQACASMGLFLCDEPGLGKTRAAIAAAEAIRREQPDRPCIVVAPGFTRDVWARELAAVGAIADASELCILGGRDHSREGIWRDGAAYYFVHYAVVSHWASRLALTKPIAAIIDEAHWIKNGATKRAGGALVASGRARMRILLTGTPMDNRVGELWHLLQVLTGSGTWGTAIAFRRRYSGAVHNGFGYQDRGPRHVAELQQRMAPWYLRRTAADLPVGSLPELRRLRISSRLSEAQTRAHDKLLDGHSVEKLIAAVLEGRAGEDTITLLTKLRKICSKAKRKATLAYVLNLLEQGQQVVLFVWQRETAQWFGTQLERRASAASGWVLHGGVTQGARDEYVQRFQATRSDAACYLAATYGVLREGVTLTRARHVVLHDLDWRFSTLLQAEKRVHRVGQSMVCMSAWAVAEDSFDDVLARLLVRKAEWIEQTLGIEEAQRAGSELDLPAMVDDRVDAAAWAQKQLERWVR